MVEVLSDTAPNLIEHIASASERAPVKPKIEKLAIVQLGPLQLFCRPEEVRVAVELLTHFKVITHSSGTRQQIAARRQYEASYLAPPEIKISIEEVCYFDRDVWKESKVALNVMGVPAPDWIG